MCGIAGYYARRCNKSSLSEDLQNAVNALTHRGPDDSGIWCNNAGVGLGHARLSIIDLSSHGHQPLRSNDGRFSLVFNGEVYNFRELRKELEPRGHVFHGTGDTEVILAAFCEWGEEAVTHFIGMFAIALWDEREKTLSLLRDRLGVKPLYYGWDGHTFCFGSELKSLRAFKHWQPEIDQQALGEFFQYGYICDPKSIYRQIKKLPPGHSLSLGQRGEPVVRRYWSVLDSLDHPLIASDAEMEEQLEDLLIDACRYRLISDVPVGVFLSGGIDSSLVTALLQRHSGQNIHTFTIGFRENRFDESPWARKVAEHLGTQHTEHILEVAQAKDILPAWASLYDEPFGDSSGIPTFLVAKVARLDVKVALSADGGDELFGGYTSYDLMPQRVASLKRIPGWMRRITAVTLRKISNEKIRAYSHILPIDGKSKVCDRLIKLKHLLPEIEPARVFDLAHSCWVIDDINRLLGRYESSRPLADIYPGAFEEQMMLWDLHHYLPGDILTKVDRATMSVGLEGREPLLDHRLVEFAFRLPLHLRRGELGSKHLLRKILYKYVPREIIERPKQGFGIPLTEWLKGDLASLLDCYLDPKRIRDAGILDPVLVGQVLKDFNTGRSIDVQRVWFLLAFEMWREKWMT